MQSTAHQKFRHIIIYSIDQIASGNQDQRKYQTVPKIYFLAEAYDKSDRHHDKGIKPHYTAADTIQKQAA